MATVTERCARLTRRLAGAGLGVALFLQAPGARAFKEPGHRLIERVAFEHLIAKGHSDVLVTLVKAGALRGGLPAQPENDPHVNPSGYVGLPQGDLNVDGVWVGSHIPDHSFDRQLQSYGQCFHFNARAEDATTPELRGTGLPIGMVHDAYLRCVSLMDLMVRGVITDAVDADRRDKGLYTLIHMVADSFSDAHAARTEDWRILYVKPWRLRTWVPNVSPANFWPWSFDMYSWRYFVTDTHHGIIDERDWDYVLPTAECQALREQPSRIEATCLSPSARRAVDAVVDLLVLVSAYVQQNPPRPGAALSAPGFEQSWNAFKSEHFEHYYPAYTAVLKDRLKNTPREGHLVSRSDRELEYRPKNVVAGAAFDLQSGSDSIWLEGTLLRSADAEDHEEIEIGQYLTHTIQLRLPLETVDGQRPLGIAYEFGGQVPSNLIEGRKLLLKLGLRIRVGYGVSRIPPRNTRHTFEMGLGGFSLDAVVMDQLWLGMIFPRWVYRLDTWGREVDDTYWTLKGGYAF